MARDNVPVTALTLNGAVTEPATTAIVVANGQNIALAGLKLLGIVIAVTNTTAGALNTTIRAGVNPPSPLAGLGDLVVSVPATSEALITIEGARFLQADQSVNVDFQAGFAGATRVYQMPRALQ